MLLRQNDNVEGFFAGFCVELFVGNILRLALALACALDVECQNQS